MVPISKYLLRERPSHRVPTGSCHLHAIRVASSGAFDWILLHRVIATITLCSIHYFLLPSRPLWWVLGLSPGCANTEYLEVERFSQKQSIKWYAYVLLRNASDACAACVCEFFPLSYVYVYYCNRCSWYILIHYIHIVTRYWYIQVCFALTRLRKLNA